MPNVKKKSAYRKRFKTVSIAIPVFNEAENIPILFDRLKEVIDPMSFNFEILFVDDGSTDETLANIKNLQRRDRRVKAVSFSRNFGHQAALTAGLQYATGDAVITMDGDLQHPPSLIPTLLEKWTEGFRIVFTTREATADESFFKRSTSRLFYRIINAFSETPVQPFAADFRLLDRTVVDSLNTLRERDRFLRGLIGWMGYSSIGVPYQANERAAGTSKYSTRKMIGLAVDGILSFSATPLHLVTYLGLAVSFLSFLYGLYSIYAYFFTTLTIPGWTSLLVTVLFLGGVQLFSIGFLGEYLIRVYNEAKGRPPYIIQEILNLDNSNRSID
jgi:polyisoprenyl-phosphate glycosyltransferase